MSFKTFNDFSKNKFVVFIILILLGSFLLKLKFATVYVTYTDEILSAIVADSISQTGLPILPSGSTYERALLHHYLLAIPVGIFGIEYVAIRINSIIFSLITVLIVYLLGKRIAVPRVAIFAAFIVSISSLFNQFALSGRMYMTYCAFYIMSFFFFYKGFILGKLSSKWFAIAFMSAAMLSSEAGRLLGPVLIFTLIVYRKTEWVKDKTIYAGCIIWFILMLFFSYRLPGAILPFTVHSGISQPSMINTLMPLKEIIVNLIYPWRVLDKVLPFSMPFFLIMTILVIKKKEFRLHYPLVVLLPALIVGSFLTYRVQYRIVIGWLPLYVLACCQFIETLIRWSNKGLVGKKESFGHQQFSNNVGYLWTDKRKTTGAIIGVYLVLVMGIICMNKISSGPDLWNYMNKAFGYHDVRVNQDLERSYQYIKSHMKSDDKIIVTTMEYGLFFLGPDYDYYYLRQKKSENTKFAMFIPFGKDKEPYYGKPLIDSVEKLRRLLKKSKNPVWLVVDYKAESSVGPEMRKFIDEEFGLVFDDYEQNRAKVYCKKT